MLRHKRILAAVVSLGILMALVIILWGRGDSREAVAADGRRVRIEGTTYGTRHSFTTGKLWVRVLKPFLGRAWAARRGSVEMRFDGTNDVLMVWTRWMGISGTNPLPMQATILDERGTESELVLCRWNQSDWQIHTNRFESTSYVGWIFRNYPRRSRTLRMRIYDPRTHDKRQALEISFANPAPKRFPQWTGQRLPVSRTNPTLQFVSAVTWTNRGTEFTLKAVDHSAHFQMQTDGQPDPSWQVGGITTMDATGNSVTRQIVLEPGLERNRVFPLPGALWPGEQAWRFSVEFSRSVDFEGHELWTTPSLTLQSANVAGPVITNSNFNGSTVIVVSPQRERQAVLWPGRTGQSAEVRAWLSPGSVPHRLFFVGALDDQNRAVQVETLSSMTFDGWHNFEFRPLSGAQSVRLTFAVRKSTIIDFDVAAQSVLPHSKTAP